MSSSYTRVPTNDIDLEARGSTLGSLSNTTNTPPTHTTITVPTAPEDTQYNDGKCEASTTGPRGILDGIRVEGHGGEDADLVTIKFCVVGETARERSVNLDWSVARTREHVFGDAIAEGKRVRLIYHGKLLEDSKSLASYGVVKDSFVHSSISNLQPLHNSTSGSNGVGAGADADADSVDDEDAAWQFHAQMLNARAAGRRGQEPGPFAVREGTTGDLVLGFVMGAILGFLALIWVLPRTVPRRQKLGILAGVMFYTFFAFRDPYNADSSSSSGGTGTGSGDSSGTSGSNP
jgi:Ubiquitin family/DSC E3 ubiquitin ligase complex subunit 3, C-terminal domain